MLSDLRVLGLFGGLSCLFYDVVYFWFYGFKYKFFCFSHWRCFPSIKMEILSLSVKFSVLLLRSRFQRL